MSKPIKRLAVIIGIDQYEHGISPLLNAVNDARKIEWVLREQHGYKTYLLLNNDAKQADLCQLLSKTLPTIVKPDDWLLFYFAGHGKAEDEQDGPQGYLIPQDAARNTASWLRMSQVHDWLLALPCHHFLAILDCCFAGAFRWSSTRDISTTQEEIFQEHYDRFINKPAWQVITSASYDQTALDKYAFPDSRGETGDHSPFAAALIEALQGDADHSPPAKDGQPKGDGVITATELYSYLRDRVEPRTIEHQKPQTPGLWHLKKHDRGEYIFLTPGHKLNLKHAPPLDASTNPYRGLESFDEAHKDWFFGRTKLVKQLRDFVVMKSLTVVLGASGAGKSSLVRAGLIPELRDRTDWTILEPIRPGESPIQELNYSLTKSNLPKIENSTYLAQSIQPAKSTVLLFIDQSEELITLCKDKGVRQEFLSQLAHAITSHPQQMRIVITIRSDFEPQLREFIVGVLAQQGQFTDQQINNFWQSARFIVPAMERSQLREAIEKPAAAKVMYFEPNNLVEKLINEVADMPGALPLLSFALSELYLSYLERQEEARKQGIIVPRAMTQADYNKIGGVIQSLTQRADKEYQKLVDEDPTYQPIIRNVMLRMVSLNGGELARRRAPRTELVYVDDHDTLLIGQLKTEPATTSQSSIQEKVDTLIQRFSDARLLIGGNSHTRAISAGDAIEEPYLEPAHDALVQGWKKLRDWIDEEQDLELQRRLTPEAQSWQRLKQQEQPLVWSKEMAPLLDWLDIKFHDVELGLSNNTWLQDRKTQIRQGWQRLWQRNSFKPEDEERRSGQHLWHDNPYINVLKTKFKQDPIWFNQLETEFLDCSLRKRRRNIAGIVGLILFGNTILVGLTAWAVFGLRNSLISEIRAAQQAAEANLIANRNLDALMSSLKASKILQDYSLLLHGVQLPFIPQERALENLVKETLHESTYGVRERIRFQHSQRASNVTVRFSPDGQRFATAGDDGTIALRNLQGQVLKQWQGEAVGENGQVWSVDFSPIDPLLASGGQNGIVRLWDFQGRELKSWDAGIGWIRSLRFSPDGKQLATSGLEGTVIWNLQEQSSIELVEQDYVWSIDFSRDGQFIATTGIDKTVRVWNRQGQELKKWEGYQNNLRSVNFSPDGQVVAIGGDWDSARLWYWQQGTYIDLKRTGVWSISFSPDGRQLAAASNDGIVRLLDLGGNELDELPKGSGAASHAHFSPNSNLLATAGDGGNIALWDIQGQRAVKLEVDLVNQDKVSRVNFSENEQQIAITTEREHIHWWNLQDEPIKLSHKEKPSIVNHCLLKDRGLQVKMHDSNTMKDDKAFLYDLNDNYVPEISEPHPNGVKSISCTNDGKLLATAGGDGKVRLWNLQQQPFKEQDRAYLESKGDWSGEQGQINVVQFSQDDKQLATGANGSVRLWDLEGNPLATWRTGQGWIKSISFSSDGRLLATVGDQGHPTVWPIESFDELMHRGCGWVHDYLATLDQTHSDRHHCKEIPQPEEEGEISSGDKILLPLLTTPDKQAGVEAIAAGNFVKATNYLQASLRAHNPNDPEARIYLNNARIGQRKSYTIAVSVPINDVSGAAEILRGVAQAQEVYNQWVKTTEGREVPFKVLIADDRNNPQVAQEIAQKLADNPDVLGVVGHFSSGVTRAAATIYNARKLAAISPVSTSVELSDILGQQVFRTIPNDTLAAKKLASYMQKSLNRKRAIVFYNAENEYSHSLTSAFQTSLEANGGKVLERIDVSDANFDAQPAVEAAIQQGAEVLALMPDVGQLDKALSIIQANNQRLPLLAGDDVYKPSILDKSGAQAMGMVIAVPWHIGGNRETEFVRTANGLWQADVNWRTVMAYDATKALMAAIKQNPDRISVGNTLGLSSFTASGATEAVQFSVEGDRKNYDTQLVKIVKPDNPSRSGFAYEFVLEP